MELIAKLLNRFPREELTHKSVFAQEIFYAIKGNQSTQLQISSPGAF